MTVVILDQPQVGGMWLRGVIPAFAACLDGCAVGLISYIADFRIVAAVPADKLQSSTSIDATSTIGGMHPSLTRCSLLRTSSARFGAELRNPAARCPYEFVPIRSQQRSRVAGGLLGTR